MHNVPKKGGCITTQANVFISIPVCRVILDAMTTFPRTYGGAPYCEDERERDRASTKWLIIWRVGDCGEDLQGNQLARLI